MTVVQNATAHALWDAETTMEEVRREVEGCPRCSALKEKTLLLKKKILTEVAPR